MHSTHHVTNKLMFKIITKITNLAFHSHQARGCNKKGKNTKQRLRQRRGDTGEMMPLSQKKKINGTKLASL